MKTWILFVVTLLLINKQISCNEETESTLEEYERMLHTVNATVTHMFKEMEMKPQRDKDYVEERLNEVLGVFREKRDTSDSNFEAVVNQFTRFSRQIRSLFETGSRETLNGLKTVTAQLEERGRQLGEQLRASV